MSGGQGKILKAQNHMKVQFDRKAVDHHFVVGDRVVDLLSQRTSGLSASFCGPYTVLKKVGDKNYGISTPEGRRKTRLCHINLLKNHGSQQFPYGYGENDGGGCQWRC